MLFAVNSSLFDIPLKFIDSNQGLTSGIRAGSLFTISKDRIMSTTKQESLKIVVLNKDDYLTWKVKIILYLEAADPYFIDMITDGPYVPKKLVAKEGTTPEHYVDKTRAEMTREERLEVLKDSKVKSILHNSLDYVMSNRVIACKTSKEIWDTLEVQF